MKKFDLKEAIENRSIIPFSDGPKLVEKELEAAKEDIENALDSFKENKFKWATIQAYYCVFHICRALLYKQKYREKSHYYLIQAIKHFYIDNGLLEKEFYDSALNAMELRELADYKRKYSEAGAKRNIETAQKALDTLESILKSK